MFVSVFRRVGLVVYKRIRQRVLGVVLYLSDFLVIPLSVSYLIFAILIYIDRWGFVLGGVVVLGLAMITQWSRSERIRRVCIAIFIAFGIAVIRMWFDYSTEKTAVNGLKEYENQKVELQAKIVDEPKYDHENVKYVLRIDSVIGRNGDVESFSSPIRVLAKSARYPKRSLGDKCTVYGQLKTPRNLIGFDYVSYLRNKRIYYTLEVSAMSCEESSFSFSYVGFGVRQKLYAAKLGVVGRIQRDLPEPQSSLLIGILLGDDRVFDDTFDDSLRVTGTTHIIAASGYNVTILVITVNWLLKGFVKPRYRILFSLGLVWSFAVMSGLSPSITRAAIMVSLALLASLSDRMKSVHLLLPLSAFVFALYDPRVVFSLSFQLSIISTAGLIYLSPVVSKTLGELGLAFKLVEDYFNPTLCCTLATFPLIVGTFGEVSMIGLISNVLILPVLESTMMLGFLALCIGFISDFLGSYFFEIVWIQLRYFEKVVLVLGEWNWAVLRLDISPGLSIGLGYILLILGLLIFTPDGDEPNYYMDRLST